MVASTPYTTQYQCVSPGPGTWCITTAYPTVPAGAPLHASGGVLDDPSQVNSIGNVPSCCITGLVSVNADGAVVDDAVVGDAEEAPADEHPATNATASPHHHRRITSAPPGTGPSVPRPRGWPCDSGT